jgi:MFS family permease
VGWRFRWSLKTMMVVVAVVAVLLGSPLLAMPIGYLALLLGGPVVGGWIAGRWGPERIVAGSVVGGVVSYTVLGGVAGLWVGLRSEMLARPAVVVLAPLLFLFMHMLIGAAAGALVGALIGAAVGTALAPLDAFGGSDDAERSIHLD